MPTESIDKFIGRMKLSGKSNVVMIVSKRVFSDGKQFRNRLADEPDKEVVMSDVARYEDNLRRADCPYLASRFRMIAGLPDANQTQT